MAYFRKLDTQLAALSKLWSRGERWLILINADPDALASAMALKRILSRRVNDVGIAHVNAVRRPDNLAMIHYLRIPTVRFTPNVAAQFDRFALVDSQPHHHPTFKDYPFSLVLDHHPILKESPVTSDFKEIKPEYGSNSTLMTEYLYNLNIRPGKLLATALLYGIKSDTQSFEREFCDVDIRAFRYLSKFSNMMLLRKIVRSEFRLEWLSYFSKAFQCIRFLKKGFYIFMDHVENPDILVVLADFFMRVHEITWTGVAGLYQDKVVLILRGDGYSRGMSNVGRLAIEAFGDIGSAGGHMAMARAEIPLENLAGAAPDTFIWERLSGANMHKKTTSCEDPAQGNPSDGESRLDCPQEE